MLVLESRHRDVAAGEHDRHRRRRGRPVDRVPHRLAVLVDGAQRAGPSRTTRACASRSTSGSGPSGTSVAIPASGDDERPRVRQGREHVVLGEPGVEQQPDLTKVQRRGQRPVAQVGAVEHPPSGPAEAGEVVHRAVTVGGGGAVAVDVQGADPRLPGLDRLGEDLVVEPVGPRGVRHGRHPGGEGQLEHPRALAVRDDGQADRRRGGHHGPQGGHVRDRAGVAVERRLDDRGAQRDLVVDRSGGVPRLGDLAGTARGRPAARRGVATGSGDEPAGVRGRDRRRAGQRHHVVGPAEVDHPADPGVREAALSVGVDQAQVHVVVGEDGVAHGFQPSTRLTGS